VEAARLKPHKEEECLRIEDEEAMVARLKYEEEAHLQIEFEPAAEATCTATFFKHKKRKTATHRAEEERLRIDN